jgi:hypothetical protein
MVCGPEGTVTSIATAHECAVRSIPRLLGAAAVVCAQMGAVGLSASCIPALAGSIGTLVCSQLTNKEPAVVKNVCGLALSCALKFSSGVDGCSCLELQNHDCLNGCEEVAGQAVCELVDWSEKPELNFKAAPTSRFCRSVNLSGLSGKLGSAGKGCAAALGGLCADLAGEYAERAGALLACAAVCEADGATCGQDAGCTDGAVFDTGEAADQHGLETTGGAVDSDPGHD